MPGHLVGSFAFLPVYDQMFSCTLLHVSVRALKCNLVILQCTEF